MVSFLNNLGPSPHITSLNYEGVRAPYGPHPPGSFQGIANGSIPQLPAFTGASFKGSVKNSLVNYPTLALTHIQG